MQLESSEFIELIKDTFDLNLYEASALYALINKKIGDAVSISSIANIPKSRVYDILESLVKKGFVTIIGSRPIKYKINSFDEIIESVKSIYEKEYEEKINRLNKALESSAFKKLKEMLDEENYPLESGLPKVYDGFNSVMKINKVIKDAKHIALISLYSEAEKLLKKTSKSISFAKVKGADVEIFLYKDKNLNIDLKHKLLDMELGNLIISDKKDIFLISRDNNRVVHLNDCYLASKYLEIANAHSH
ncbi:MAG: helix-turn-helix domain-containing protein [Candidatus Rehaiarchaeum fermentans]|nr:hypothetical protein [Candidatus Rehaiarchaeum fermentans]MCW1297357.1 hypothetical protein [Candidatus Rehaiarchaeum fermentans]MCW1302142.1 hypothetical protein [Candidatus Rehaiarchaeum fermentans]